MFFDEERCEWLVDTMEVKLEDENSQPTEDEDFVMHGTSAYV